MKLPEILNREVFLRAIKTSLLVGTVLSVINYWEFMVYLEFQMIPVFKIAMNFLVPYLVASFTIVKTKEKSG